MTDATSQHELPYLEPSDTLAIADNVVRDLAERLDLLLGEIGTTVVTVAAADTNQTERVDYAREYAAPSGTPALGTPNAFLTLGTAAGSGGDVTLWSVGHDATGFTLGIRAGTAGTYTVRWAVRL